MINNLEKSKNTKIKEQRSVLQRIYVSDQTVASYRRLCGWPFFKIERTIWKNFSVSYALDFVKWLWKAGIDTCKKQP